MPGKYEPLTLALRAAAARGQDTVDLGFDQVAELVHGLPASAELRQWWANNSQSQGLAWRAAGFHVERVYLDRRRVRFARGERGGSYHDRGRLQQAPRSQSAAPPAGRTSLGRPVDVRVWLQWLDGGTVMLDASGKLAFGGLEATPGLYRMRLAGDVTGQRPRVYIGESDNLRRRLSGNYRTPGPRQQTSLRINALLREHLRADGAVELGVATTATMWLNGAEQALDLNRKAGRLLAESAALVLAQAADDAEIVNL